MIARFFQCTTLKNVPSSFILLSVFLNCQYSSESFVANRDLLNLLCLIQCSRLYLLLRRTPTIDKTLSFDQTPPQGSAQLPCKKYQGFWQFSIHQIHTFFGALPCFCPRRIPQNLERAFNSFTAFLSPMSKICICSQFA
jgi:hypothetical protein